MAEQQQEGGNRQKIIIGVMVVVVAIIAWQVMGLFGGGSGSQAPVPQMSPQQLQAQMETPKPAKVARPEVMSEREAQLMRLQQETEAKYIAALNELQMLKIEKDIATTNKDISKARLDSVKAQKDIVDLLAPKPEPTPTIGGQVQGSGPTAQQPSATISPAALPTSGVSYSVISVSKAHGKWNAVLAAAGKLYSVSVGDIMPTDRAKVVKIDDSGVVLELDGKREKVSLVPII